MRLRSPGLWVALASVAGVVAFVWTQAERTSPGPLSAVHAEVAELAAGDACAACHGDGPDTLADACGACHEDVARSIAAGLGLHGGLVGEGVRDCGRCHLEHHGRETPLNESLAFRRVGFEDARVFDHVGIGFPLVGLHEGLACEDCHPNAHVPRLAEGQRRFLGLRADCGSCHEDVHEGKMIRDCAECHTERAPFHEVSAHEHRDARLDRGGHDGLRCQTCHVRGSGRAVEDVLEDPELEPRRCADCHEAEHSDAFLGAVAADLGSGPSCGACHGVERGAFQRWGTASEDWHAWTGFALEEPHADVDCAACHADGAAVAPEHPRSPDACAACHADPHAGQFVDDRGALRGCQECHAPDRFEPHAFDATAHALTGFPLADGHADVACDACHERAGDAPRTFVGTSSACDACHDRVHDGPILEQRRGCEECHVPTRFDDVDLAAFDHGAWTRFPLDGSHATAACETCHPRSTLPDEHGRRFGRVADVFGADTTACGTCHVDAHGGAFGERAPGCEACHRTTSFRDLATPFDHASWTPFALNGAHAELACERCHARTADPDATGRTFGRAHAVFGSAVRRCDDCHAPAHGSLFAQHAGATPDCGACHSEVAFGAEVEGFDHLAWTGVSLGGAHSDVSCEACHPAVSGEARRLGPATGRSCVACHLDPHLGQFVRDGRTDCAECHDAEGTTTFDHERQSRFSLAGPHEGVACAECHLTFSFAEFGDVVRYRPLAQDCGDCHAAGGGR